MGSQPAGEAPEVPEDARGIFVMCDTKCARWASEVIYNSCVHHSGLPVIAAILDTPGSAAEEVGTLLSVQRQLQSAGADDVMLKVSTCDPELARTEVLMSMQRAERRGEDHALFSQLMHQKEEEDGGRNNSMFWECAHQVFKGFPRQDRELDTSPAATAFNPGQPLGQHRFVLELGRGAFGSVHLCEEQETNQLEAVKAVEKQSLKRVSQVRNLWREMSILGRLNHGHIVRLHGATHTTHHVLLHMEFVGRRNLHQVISEAGRLPMEQVWEVGAQVAAALAHCHDRSIAHLDVKPPNVVVCTDRFTRGSTLAVKLVDFGLATEVVAGSSVPRCGTMPFCAPEMLGEDSYFDPRSADVWSHGVMSLEMAFGLGQTCRLLGWPSVVEPTRERWLDLVKFFPCHPAGLADGLLAAGADSSVVADEHLLSILAKQFEVDVTHRSTAAEVSTRMAEYISNPRSRPLKAKQSTLKDISGLDF